MKAASEPTRSIHICHIDPIAASLLCSVVKTAPYATPLGLRKWWNSEDNTSLSILSHFSPLETRDLLSAYSTAGEEGWASANPSFRCPLI